VKARAVVFNARFVSTTLASSVLAVGFGMGRLWVGTAAAVVLGIVWLIGQRREWRWSASACFVSLVVVAAVAIWVGVEPAFSLIGVVAALAAWDLHRFTRRLRLAQRVIDVDQLSRRHLWRLGFVCGLGLLLGGLGLAARVELGLGVALLLGILALLGISLALGFVRSERR
jgi:hypothetical protein